MAARTSGGRLVEVWVINSSKLLGRNCINFILDGSGGKSIQLYELVLMWTWAGIPGFTAGSGLVNSTIT
jgi:hypothetical protein